MSSAGAISEDGRWVVIRERCCDDHAMSESPAEWLRREGASTDVVSWASAYATLDEAIAACPRGDWVLAIAAKRGAEASAIVRAAARIAELGTPYVRDAESEARASAAIAIAKRAADGEQIAASERAAAHGALEEAIGRAMDPAAQSALMAALAALTAIEAPIEAASTAAMIAQAAAMDAGECAMTSALRWAQSESADIARAELASSTTQG